MACPEQICLFHTIGFGGKRGVIGAPAKARRPILLSVTRRRPETWRAAYRMSTQENTMTTQTFTKMAPPPWLLAMWKEIDEKTFGKGFDCFATDAVCNLGVADWHGRETIRENLRAFIDTGFTAYHEVLEYWDSPSLKIFRGTVAMTFDDPGVTPKKPSMVHFFYMDKKDPSKVSHWIGAVGPVGF
jgi:hypothetical protein